MRTKETPSWESLSEKEKLSCELAANQLSNAFEWLDEEEALQCVLEAVNRRGHPTHPTLKGCQLCGIILFDGEDSRRKHNKEFHGTGGRQRKKMWKMMGEILRPQEFADAELVNGELVSPVSGVKDGPVRVFQLRTARPRKKKR